MDKLPQVEMRRKGYYYVRLPLNAGYDEILIDQRIQTGAPCIRGTRIPVSTIYAIFKSGSNIKSIANDYKISVIQVKAAIDYIEGK